MACHCELKEEPHRRDAGTVIYWLRRIIPSGMADDVEVRDNLLFFHDRLVGKVRFAEVILGDADEKGHRESVYTPIFTFLGPFQEFGFEKDQLNFWVTQHLYIVANEVVESTSENRSSAREDAAAFRSVFDKCIDEGDFDR